MKLIAETVEEYLDQFNVFLDSDAAKNTKGIIYVWKTDKPINKELKGRIQLFILVKQSILFVIVIKTQTASISRKSILRGITNT